MDDLSLLKIRLLRRSAYRCSVPSLGALCGDIAHNIALFPNRGWLAACPEHCNQGDGCL